MKTSIKQGVLFRDLGQLGYQDAWDLQEKLLQENVAVKTAIRNRQSAVGSGQLAVANGQLTIGNGQLAISDKSGQAGNRQSTIDNRQSTIDNSRPDVTEISSPSTGGGRGEAIDNEEVVPSTKHYLLFVEHPPVYTLGKSGDIENVLISEEERAAKGISFYHTNRGGDITFHGREQLVGYPILDLERFYTDIGKYLRNLEEVIIATMADYGLKGERSPGETGVWLDAAIPGRERKICAMGIRCSRWITMHGFAFNVNTDLSYFNYIIPCGIQNKQVTSLQKELGYSLNMNDVKMKVRKNFEKVFDVELIPPTP